MLIIKLFKYVFNIKYFIMNDPCLENISILLIDIHNSKDFYIVYEYISIQNNIILLTKKPIDKRRVVC